jgi:two-component sensor histidine kinase
VFYLFKVFDFHLKNEINSINVAEFNLLFLLFLIVLLGGVFGRMMNNTNYKIKKAKQEIVKNNEEKSVMLKEIHHRVKNNLQVVNSLLRMQSRNMVDENVKEVFKSAQNRVITMARLHENIYQTKDLKNINVSKYFTELIRDLIKNNTIDKQISSQLHISQIKMSIDVLLPVSLIINEIVSNSLKHAFNGSLNGEIKIELIEVEGKECKLTVCDNGFASNIDMLSDNFNSTGVTLIKTLTRQLNGSIKVLTLSKGTGYEICFSNSMT